MLVVSSLEVLRKSSNEQRAKFDKECNLEENKTLRQVLSSDILPTSQIKTKYVKLPDLIVTSYKIDKQPRSLKSVISYLTPKAKAVRTAKMKLQTIKKIKEVGWLNNKQYLDNFFVGERKENKQSSVLLKANSKRNMSVMGFGVQNGKHIRSSV